MFRDIKGGEDETLFSISEDLAERERRCRTGPKGQGILCGSCEADYQKYDTWMIDALRQEPVALPGTCMLDFRYLSGVDATRLKMGLMHMLWRAHAATADEYAPARMSEKQADRLRLLLRSDSPGGEREFAPLLFRYGADPDGLDQMIGPVTPLMWVNRARGVEFHLGRWRIAITCSAAGPPRDVALHCVKPGEVPAVLVAPSFRESPLFKNSIATARLRGWASRHHGAHRSQE